MPVRERDTTAHALPGRTPPIEREQSVRDPEWSSMKTTINRKFKTEPELRRLFRQRQQAPFFRAFFRGRLDITLGRGSEQFDTLIDRYLNPNLPTYNPDLFDIAAPILKTITAETQKLAPRPKSGLIRK